MAKTRFRIATLVAGVGFLCGAGSAFAASAGEFASWGVNDGGTIQVSFNLGGNNSDTASASVVDANGFMYVSGTVTDGQNVSRFGVIRLDPDGKLDTAFSSDGRASSLRTNVVATGVALSADGAYVYVSGYTLDDPADPDAIVCRFRTSNGTNATFPGFVSDACPTTTFFDGAPDRAYDIAVQDDGHIVLAGEMAFANAPSATYAAFTRFDANGAPDLSFGSLQGSNLAFVRDTALYAAHRVRAVAVAPDGRIVAAGSTRLNNGMDQDGLMVVINADGSEPNTSESVFDEDGQSALDTIVRDVVVLAPAEGELASVVLAGDIGLPGGRKGGYLAKLSINGSFDLDGFGVDGAVMTLPLSPFSVSFTHVAEQANGNIIVAGMSTSQGLADSDIQVRRFSGTGVLDQDFGTGDAFTKVDFGSPDGNNVTAGLSVRANEGIYIGASVLETDLNTNYAAAKLQLDTMFADGFED